MKNIDEEKLFTRMAKNSKEFVVILGAGASRPAGLPGWEGLRDNLVKKLDNYYRTIDGVGDDEREKTIKKIKEKPNLWDAFTLLAQKLHATDYASEVNDSLSVKNKNIPELYKLIWNLNIAGIITYNLDDFAAMSNPQASVSHWKEANKYANYLHFDANFIFHPHGRLNDKGSWVLTRAERDHAYKEQSFINFMTALINTKHILIIGFNPNDQSFLDMLDKVRIGTETCFDKTIFSLHPSPNGRISKEEYDKFADKGICAVPYKNDNQHQYLIEFLEKLRKKQKLLQYEETNYSVIQYKPSDNATALIPSPSDMNLYSYNTLRRILCNALSNLAFGQNASQADEEKIRDFYHEYSEQLFLAWRVNPSKNDREANKIFDYTVKARKGKGSFGSVYEAEDEHGNTCAIKVLLHEVTGEDNYLNCFRRGVHTMKILSDHNLAGVVRLREAFEIPACIVMDYIHGLTLREAIDEKLLKQSNREAYMKLEIILSIAVIINEAHKLDESVLHRDLKPENIILEDFYCVTDDNETLRVKIVDFDLSWHRGAQGLTVAATGSAGFVAPEQLPGTQSRSKTKNAAVDIYSIGMLLFYVLAEYNPYPNQHEFKTFREDIDRVIAEKYHFQWHTTRKYLADLIIDATKQNQNERIPLSSFIGKLKAVIQMEGSYQALPSSHELLTQEIAYRVDRTMTIETAPSGINGDITAHQSNFGRTFNFKRIYKDGKFYLSIEIVTRHTGNTETKNIPQRTKTAIDKAKSKMNRSLFLEPHFDWETRAIIGKLTAPLDDETTLKTVKDISNNLKEVSYEMSFLTN